MTIFGMLGIVAAVVALVAILKGAEILQRRSPAGLAVVMAACAAIIVAAVVALWRVSSQDCQLEASQAAATRAEAERQRAAVRPLKIVCQKAAADRGIGGAKYYLWLRNDDTAPWKGDLSVQAVDGAGRVVARDYWQTSIPAGQIAGYNLSGDHADALRWACTSHGQPVASGQASLR